MSERFDPAAHSISGLILAGGQARRLGHVDKGLVRIGSREMVRHVAAALVPLVNNVLVSANRSIDVYHTLGLDVVEDCVGESAGPLAGMHAGLSASECAWVLVVPCDVPLITTPVLEQLCRAATESHVDIAYACDSERSHPAVAMVRSCLVEDLEKFLNAGGRRILAWYERHAVIEVNVSATHEFMNVNTPADVELVARYLS
ncbi:molybdenum cofactor guanylyltransferase MobA [Larsenimonas rhizosphaerae]|uniref:molybdenum cofactor guanylyltransferase MobA n=1 Tax=Larsenimonas rhizosphaerae TaxID=2944682 RepID=UPI0020345E36|nr:molybdenum cofactor guanylyltransferase MobA [Larsenimonas rhizosphaerae]MCM2130453.1 molybdenum cofactor guanylyltransferase [Larsenimonas rhizosphaerae]